jgi:hypothetical protein
MSIWARIVIVYVVELSYAQNQGGIKCKMTKQESGGGGGGDDGRWMSIACINWNHPNCKVEKCECQCHNRMVLQHSPNAEVYTNDGIQIDVTGE